MRSRWDLSVDSTVCRPHHHAPGPAIRAIGSIVTLAGLRAEDGRDVLREISQHPDIKVRDVAELIVWAHAGHLASDIRHKLERSMATRATLRPEPG
ncbi:hypothetical protein [Streptomyces sp. NPDC057696]|uniref:hypothetical protein n=1 Tax=Streptomyces sp. NPDC057696 TaxID=3346218 RepID=UPI0036B0749B